VSDGEKSATGRRRATVLHAILMGMDVGMIVCAGVWIGIVALAMT
jgi:hypothetical protein